MPVKRKTTPTLGLPKRKRAPKKADVDMQPTMSVPVEVHQACAISEGETVQSAAAHPVCEEVQPLLVEASAQERGEVTTVPADASSGLYRAPDSI